MVGVRTPLSKARFSSATAQPDGLAVLSGHVLQIARHRVMVGSRWQWVGDGGTIAIMVGSRWPGVEMPIGK